MIFSFSKKRDNIILASLLKPINDVRMYGKLGKSLAKSLENNTQNQAEKSQKKIHIIGFKPKNEVKNTENFVFYPIFNFKRLSVKRLFAQFLFFYFLLKIRPKILIVCTFELLFFAIIYKILFGAILIYDVQENYYANIRYTNVFPVWLKIPLAYLVHFWEKICCFGVNEFWLAEKCYLEELSLYKRKYIFLENKVIFEQIKYFLENKENRLKNSLEIPSKQIKIPTKFLISGTLGEDYGTLKAINWCKNYYKIDQNIHLTMIGFCAKNSDLEKIQNNILGIPYITLIGGSTLVNPNKIMSEAMKTDFWVMPYAQNENIKNRIPTKFYESMAFQKNIIVSENLHWKDFFIKNSYIKNICFSKFLPENVLQDKENIENMRNNYHNYHNSKFNVDIFWENEAKNLEKSVVFKQK